MPSQAINDAYNAATFARFAARSLRFDVKLDLTIDKVMQESQLTARQRIRLAGQILRDATVVNLSRPVRKYRSKRTGRTMVDPKSRSQPYEFPYADTTRLMKDIFVNYDNSDPNSPTARIGTTLGYGLVLESKLRRSFLRRTFNEYRERLLLIVQGAP